MTPAAPPLTSARIDAWLSAVRLAKTRSLATAACKAGHIRVNGDKAKPSHTITVGDRVTVRRETGPRIVEVTRLIVKRVGAPVAVQCYIDHTPVVTDQAPRAAHGDRDRGAGRPTKRDRRDIDRLQGRSSRS